MDAATAKSWMFTRRRRWKAATSRIQGNSKTATWKEERAGRKQPEWETDELEKGVGGGWGRRRKGVEENGWMRMWWNRRRKKKKKADPNLYQPLGETPAGGKISSAFEKRGSGEVYWVLGHVVSRGHAGKCEWNLFFTHSSHPTSDYVQVRRGWRGWGAGVFTACCRGRGTRQEPQPSRL